MAKNSTQTATKLISFGIVAIVAFYVWRLYGNAITTKLKSLTGTGLNQAAGKTANPATTANTPLPSNFAGGFIAPTGTGNTPESLALVNQINRQTLTLAQKRELLDATLSSGRPTSFLYPQGKVYV